ncbi:hypothetical protein CXB40_15080 [Pseudomonas syringae pv. avii]|nr:hypothetical protein CXB40_15080 [Pseudomonas syringae pv. avii]
MTIVPMLRVGMHPVTLCVTNLSYNAHSRSDAERPERRTDAERRHDSHRFCCRFPTARGPVRSYR